MNTRVFVTVGTDHHPFTRLIDWVDHWADARTDLDLVVQHGPARPARHGVNHELLDASDVAEQFAAADLVISQVGPGTIADANRAGHRPFVVPRDPALGEVVDDHQVAFGDFMAARGRCVSIRTRDHLIAELEAWMSASEHPALPTGALPSTTSTTLADLSRAVVAAPRRRFSARRLLTVMGPVRAADPAV